MAEFPFTSIWIVNEPDLSDWQLTETGKIIDRRNKHFISYFWNPDGQM